MSLLDNDKISLFICFFCVGCIHKLKGTRSISELNSFLDNSPILAGFFIFCAFASIGFPLTSGFISEFLIINGIYKNHTSFKSAKINIKLITRL